MSTERPAPGELVWHYPDCPLCGDETDGDGDSFRCDACGCYWATTPGDEGEWEYDTERCRMSLTHAVHPILSGQCVLSDGHKGEHNNDKTTWHSDRIDRGRSTESEVAS